MNIALERSARPHCLSVVGIHYYLASGRGPFMSFEEIYDNSYERVVDIEINGKDFFTRFYDIFLASSEDIRQKFIHTNMEKQRTMLKKSFYHLLIFYGSNQANHYIEDIAKSHDKAHANIPPRFYDLWLDALIETVKEFDPEFSDDIELAWRLVLSPGITYMKFFYDRSGSHS